MQGASSTKALPKGRPGHGERPAQPSQPCVLQQTLSGGREGGGLEPLDPRSGKPDARPGTDASSRAIFTNQWMQRRSRSWNWSCCSSLPAQPGWRDPGSSRGSARNSGTAHTARGFLPTPSLRVSSPSESTEKPFKALSTEKPESSNLNGSIFPAMVTPTCTPSPPQGQLTLSWTSQQHTHTKSHVEKTR